MPSKSRVQRIWRAANPEKACEYSRRARTKRLAANPNYYRDYYRANGHALRGKILFRKYGITLVEWDAMFAAQNSRCKICLSSTTHGLNWHTDHYGPLPCTKERVRGILCMGCNHSIGRGDRDDAIRLRRQMQYVERSL
jgi:hypothetical protein